MFKKLFVILKNLNNFGVCGEQICKFIPLNCHIIQNRLHVIANLMPFDHKVMAGRLCLVDFLLPFRLIKVVLKLAADTGGH